MGASILDFSEEDNIAGEDDFLIFNSFWTTWMGMPVHQMSVLLGVGMSIFTLFVVYLGGRSKHRRFNDRTLDSINFIMADLLKTARIRAVFNFLFLILHPQEAMNKFMQTMKTLLSLLTTLLGSPVRGVLISAPVRSPRTVHSRPILIRRVKL